MSRSSSYPWLQRLHNEMRQLWSKPAHHSDLGESWFANSTTPGTGGGQGTSGGDNSMIVDELNSRIAELIADNDDQAVQLWAMQVAMRVLAERIVELEGQ